jgi:hypothetical protein
MNKMTKKPMCGAYSDFKQPDEISNSKLTDNFNAISELECFKNLKLEDLLKNYVYKTQIVAGVNYKFHVTHENDVHDFVIYQKLDQTYQLTYNGKIN